MMPTLPIICNYYGVRNSKFHLPSIKHSFAEQQVQYCLIKLLEYCSIIARNILPRPLVEQFPIKIRLKTRVRLARPSPNCQGMVNPGIKFARYCQHY